jgi:WD40 repeat protein
MEVLLTFLGHSSPVVKMTKIGSSEMLATASETGELAFWDLRLAQDMASTQGHFGTS